MQQTCAVRNGCYVIEQTCPYHVDMKGPMVFYGCVNHEMYQYKSTQSTVSVIGCVSNNKISCLQHLNYESQHAKINARNLYLPVTYSES